MATEYTITYTFTGQNNTSGSRTVPFSKFVATGDVDKNIGQIKSIQYVHYHTSAGSMHWNLRGALMLSDATVFTSDSVSKHIHNDIVGYVNTFEILPTAEQFKSLAFVQTLDSQGKATAGGYASKLYWRATSDYPIHLIVKFVEEPPVTYAPKVELFKAERCDNDGIPNEEGQYARVSLKLSVGNDSETAVKNCRLYIAADAYPKIGTSQYIDLTSRISELITGVENSTNIITGVLNLSNVWNFAVVFTVGEESAIATATISRGTVCLHLSKYPGGGAAVGGFSSGTTEKPKFESHVPAHLYAGIDGVTIYSADEVKIGTWLDGKPIYRRVLEFNATTLNTILVVATIPDMKRPVRIDGWLSRADNEHMPLQFYILANNYNCVWVGDDRLYVYTTHAVTGVVFIEYTKTTD